MSLHLFNFSEAIAMNYRSAIPQHFRINPKKAASQYDILVMRILTSSLEIRNTKSKEIVNLDFNYTSYPLHQVSRKSSKQLKSFLYPFSFDDYSEYSKKFYPRNINFYHNLLQELTYFFYYSHLKQHQSAFVNLYRVLEYVSYSFPLIHTSHFGNFIGSFEALRGYFVDAKTSEIKFFEKFLGNLFKGTSYLSYGTVFDFSSSDTVVATNCFNAFHGLINSSAWINADRLNFTLQTENENMIPLFKNVRNRYFHFAIGGQRNIQITDLKDPDFFFERINMQFLNWIAFIYATVIKESLDNTIS